MGYKTFLAFTVLAFLLSPFSYAEKKNKRSNKHLVKISTSAIKARSQAQTGGPRPKSASPLLWPSPARKYWEVDISTTEIAAIKQDIDSQPKIRGVHITAWIAGDDRLREQILKKISETVINSVVVAVKEINGKVYLPGIKKTRKWGSHENAIQDPKKMMNDFKKLKLYTMARVVCFHDNIVPAKNPSLAVKNPEGLPWKSRKGDTWVDPYNKEVWDYILDVAEKAAQIGFDEIQFDYVRYPTDGDTNLCCFSQEHNKENAARNIASFLRYARTRLSKYRIKISADVFGLTIGSDMGIGQDLNLIAENTDAVYPMMYPSHYYNKEYELDNPDSQPYKLIDRALKHALKKTRRNYAKIRPYLQDFSLRWKYGPSEVRAQILAARANMLDSWILWNPAGKYSWEALTPQMYRAFIDPTWEIRTNQKSE